MMVWGSRTLPSPVENDGLGSRALPSPVKMVVFEEAARKAAFFSIL
jgi:hypothetical protein